MTTETVSKESLDKALAEAQSALDTVNKTVAEAMQALVKGGDFSPAAMAKNRVHTDAQAKAEATVTSARLALADFIKNSTWATLEAARNPVRHAIRELMIGTNLGQAIVSATGRILIDEDGQATVSLTPVFAKFDPSEIEALISQNVDGLEFLKAGVSSIDFNVDYNATGGPMINDLPTPSGKAAVARANTDGQPRAGSIKYSHAGKEYGAMEFIKLAADAGNKRAATFLTNDAKRVEAGKAPGNGVSNYAKDVVSKDGFGAIVTAPAKS